MMNKAEKRVVEVRAIESAYNAVASTRTRFAHDFEYWQERKAEYLEDNEDYDTVHLDEEIEVASVSLKTIDKVLETIYKLM